MPKKASTPTAPEATTPTAPRYDWPQSLEPRPLFVTLAPREMEIIGRQLAATVPQIGQLERDAKASASQWEARIETVRCQQDRLSGIVTEGREERSVECEWVFECCGVDSATLQRMFHPEKKTLFRTDTWEPVETRDITSDERQMSLIPDDEPAEDIEEPQNIVDIDSVPDGLEAEIEAEEASEVDESAFEVKPTEPTEE